MTDNEDPAIGATEARSQLRWITTALSAPDAAARRTALANGIVEFGIRLSFGLEYMAEIEAAHEGVGTQYADLREEVFELFMGWLAGHELTDRADEDERRATEALRMRDRTGPGMNRIAAKAMLKLADGHPLRDDETARAWLLAKLETDRAAPAGDDFALTADVLLDFRLLSPEESVRLVDEGAGLIDSIEDPENAREFLSAAVGYYAAAAIEARDAGEQERQREWLARAQPLLGALPVTGAAASRNGLLIGLLLALDEQPEGAAEAFQTVVDAAGLQDRAGLVAAMHEARIRVGRAEFERVLAILEPRLPAFAEIYVTAVTRADVESAGSDLIDVAESVTIAAAACGRWETAIRALELSKSLRFRHRAAMRRSRSGRRLLRLEADLHASARGGAVDAPRAASRSRDFLGVTSTPQARLLEAYRRARPPLPEDQLRGPSVAQIAGSLRSREVAVVLGLTRSGTLAAVIAASDEAEPAAVVWNEAWTWNRWLDVFGAWVVALAEDGHDRRAALDALLAAVDDALAGLGPALTALDPRELVVVPHRLLHLVPFDAAAPFAGRPLLVAPSVELLAAARRRRRRPPTGRSVTVANPTLDLPASVSEAAAIAHHLGAAGVTLAGGDSTRAAVSEALSAAADVFHFCGHGASDLLDPDRSALQLCPEPGLGDPFEGCDEERLVETVSEDGELLARTLEDGGRTLRGRYVDGELVGLAELWTAGDVMVGGALRSCELAVLSACESGAGGLGLEVDEYAGLPAALQLAGAGTVVSTLWPVSDTLTALQVDLLYEALAAHEGRVVDLAAVVRDLGERVRTLSLEEAEQRLAGLRALTADPLARVVIEAYANRLPGRGPRPFEHPYDWATFRVTGTGRARLRMWDVRAAA